jgi:hypothetical protein
VKVPRFRIAWAMVFVAIAALNFGAIRAWSDLKTSNGGNQHVMLMIDALGAGAMPMANILAVGLLISLRHRGSRPFLSGFEAFGATALALYVAGAIFFTEELVMPYLNLALKPLAKTMVIGPFPHTVFFLVIVSVAGVMLVLPQVALALIGGLLFRKFKIAERSGPTSC